MNLVYLSLGSNQGDRVNWMEQAIAILQQNGCTIISKSSFYETAAWGLTDQPDFLNMCLSLNTCIPITKLLQLTQQTETALGRSRAIKWGPRTLDIDILFFNNEIIETETLNVPHPFLQDRRFVLLPLAEIAPKLMHPISMQTIEQLLATCPDELEVKKYAQ